MKLLFRPKNTNTKIRYDIQFLRAIAVLAVVIYHLFPTKLVGGFMGVDVFFVISGYLMTKSLIKDFNQGYLDQKFSPNSESSPKKSSSLENIKILARFYARRIKRLAPAASICLIIVLTTSLFTGLWPSILELSKQVFASATFLQNIYLWRQRIDYNNQYVPDSAVQHFWSLSLEEQFYMIWPILLLISLVLGYFIFRKKIKFVEVRSKDRTSFNLVWLIPTIIIIIFTLFSFGVGFWLTNVAGAFAERYFLTPARIWELSLGGIICFLPTYDQELPFQIKRKPNLIANNISTKLKLLPLLIIPWLGLLSIFLALFIFDGSDFPGWKALVPTLGTVLIIYGGSFSLKNLINYDNNNDSDFNDIPKFQKLYDTLSLNNFARFRPFQSIGDASYSIYLYYCPVIILVPTFLEIYLFQGHELLRIILFFLILILGYLSYYLIEQPTRKYKFTKRPTLKILTIGIFLMLIVVVFSLVVQNFAQNKVDSAFKEIQTQNEVALNDPNFESSCFGAVSLLNPDKCRDDLWTLDTERALYASKDLDMVRSTEQDHADLDNLGDWTFGDLSSSKTILLWGDSKAAQYSNALDYAAQKLGYKLIVSWFGSCDATHFSKEVGENLFGNLGERTKKCIENSQRTYDELIPKVDYVFLVSSAFRYLESDSVDYQYLADIINYDDSYQIPTYIISDVPENQIRFDIDFCYQNPINIKTCETNTLQDLISRDQTFISNLQKYTEDFIFIDTLENFCDDEICHLANGGVPIYFDPLHLTGTYSDSMGPWFVRELQKLGF